MTDLVKIVQPEFDFQTKDVKGVFIGSSSSTRMGYTSQTGTSNNNSVFNVVLPSKDCVMQTNCEIEYYNQLDFTVTPAPGLSPLVIPNVDGVRQYPISQQISSASCQLDTVSTQTQGSGELLAALDKYYLEMFEKNRDLGLVPNYPDTGLTYGSTFGTVRNPLAKGEINASHRGDYIIDIVSNVAGAGTAQVKFKTTEPLFLLSPFGQKNISDKPGISGIATMVLTINYRSDMSRVWCHDVANENTPILTVTHSFYAAPKLILNFLTPPPSLGINLKKESLYLPHTFITPFKSNTVNLTSGATSQYTFQNLSLTSVPDCVFIFGQRTQSTKTYLTTDTFASIENVDITFNNKSAQLTQFSKEDLYLLCVQNGLKNMAFSDWGKNVGSILKIEMGKDIQLDDLGLVAPGSVGSWNMQITATFKNNYSTTEDFTFYAVAYQEGAIKIMEGFNVILSAGITKQQVMDATYVSNKEIIRGGDLMSSLGKLKQGFEGAFEIGKDYVGPLLLGAGKEENSGGKVIGGKLLTRQQLRDMQK
jgi:hypothetical protein